MGTVFNRNNVVKLTKLAIAVAAGGAVYIWADGQDRNKKK